MASVCFVQFVFQLNPQLVLVACGFDAVMGDVESDSNLIPAAYPHLIHMLKSLANGKLGLILEVCITVHIIRIG